MLDSTGSIDQLFNLIYKIKCWVCEYENEFDNPLIEDNDQSIFRKYFMFP